MAVQFIESSTTLTVDGGLTGFTSLSSALADFADKIIAPGVTVTISMKENTSGHIYEEADQIILNHPQLNQVVIDAGDDPITKNIDSTIAIVSHHREWHEVVFELSNTTNIENWEMAYIDIPASSATVSGNFEQLCGTWPILHVDTTNDRVHVLVADQNAALDSTASIANSATGFSGIRAVIKFTQSEGLQVDGQLGQGANDFKATAVPGFGEIALVGPRGFGALADITTSGGAITAVDIVYGGMNYTNANNFAPDLLTSAGSGAEISFTINAGAVAYVAVIAGGSGYALNDEVTFSNGATAVVCQVNSGAIVAMRVTDPKSGADPDSPPTVSSWTGSGTGATVAACIKDGVIASASVANGGSGYSNESDVRILTPEKGGTQNQKANGIVVQPNAALFAGRNVAVFGFPSHGVFVREYGYLEAVDSHSCANGGNGYNSLNGSEMILTRVVANGNASVGLTSGASATGLADNVGKFNEGSGETFSVVASEAFLCGNGTQGMQASQGAIMVAPLAHIVSNLSFGVLARERSMINIDQSSVRENGGVGVKATEASYVQFVDATAYGNNSAGDQLSAESRSTIAATGASTGDTSPTVGFTGNIGALIYDEDDGVESAPLRARQIRVEEDGFSGEPHPDAAQLVVGATDDAGMSILVSDTTGTRTAGIFFGVTDSSANTDLGRLLYYFTDNSMRFYTNDGFRAWLTNAGAFRPATDGSQDLGHASYEWRDIYLVNNPIVSSDAEKKTDVMDLAAGL